MGHNLFPCHHIQTPSGSKIYWRGPALDEGRMPAFFYFSLSGEESLSLPPYNQPADELASVSLRVFSLTVPGHGEGMDPTKAIAFWANEVAQGRNVIESFVQEVIASIDWLVQHNIVDPAHIAAGGLSRGGFIATHLAARDERVKTILGFAPVTRISEVTDFDQLQEDPLALSLNLDQFVDKLVDKHLRFYMGNRDHRVSTLACFQFISALTETVYQAGHRSPPVELVITPSIGHKGHGTSPETFEAGSHWVKKRLLSHYHPGGSR